MVTSIATTTSIMNPLSSSAMASSADSAPVSSTSLPTLNHESIGKYGLKNLSSLVRMEQSDYTNYAIGQDISKCGLDLNSDVEILKNWASPWSETSRSEVEPFFQIPTFLQNSTLAKKGKSPGAIETKIQSLTDETLFYIFYMKPRDTLQEYAARELVARNWRYHKDIQVWLTKDSNIEPVLIGQDVEKGVYIFFDPHNWEKIRKEFVLHYSSVQA
ncbi:CDC36 [Candida oxycetoniae]|uniref:CDC36 n=1 Tax=Candida oxycetoniae TaxID=497107 RepID=A0AAI9SZS5_9ASCO|nr:CDC36 [Candida oxycetoniae]KAI3405370.2 CDC36 [Candida oxycetoniae]